MKRKKIEITLPPIPQQYRHLLNEKDNNNPDNILQNALTKIYGIDSDDKNKYNEFIIYLMQNLSSLVTNGKDLDLFETDFNKFISLVVHSINECGEMYELLKQYGIDYKPKWLNDNNNDEEE